MKKLNKLVISPDKIMKNEELINLQGGYSDKTCYCWKNGSDEKKTVENCACDDKIKDVCGDGWDGFNCA